MTKDTAAAKCNFSQTIIISPPIRFEDSMSQPVNQAVGVSDHTNTRDLGDEGGPSL